MRLGPWSLLSRKAATKFVRPKSDWGSRCTDNDGSEKTEDWALISAFTFCPQWHFITSYSLVKPDYCFTCESLDLQNYTWWWGSYSTVPCIEIEAVTNTQKPLQWYSNPRDALGSLISTSYMQLCTFKIHLHVPFQSSHYRKSTTCMFVNIYTWKFLPPSYTDIDECAVGSHNCEHICNNTVGGFNCSCRDGFLPSHDEASCTGDLTVGYCYEQLIYPMHPFFRHWWVHAGLPRLRA